jgi:activator of HSP90 ATPase
MDISPGGEFSLWNNTVQGINRVVTPTRIEQDWKEEEWKYPSNVVITLAAQPDGSTQVVLIHEGIPSLNFKAIDAGWDEYYLGAIKDYLEGR